jgi:CBS domain-containing protein
MKGVISFQDIRNLLSEHQLDYLVVAQDIVSPETLVLHENDDLEDANNLFGQRDLMMIPVLDSSGTNKVIGVLRRDDLIDFYNKRLIDRLRT